MEGVKKQCMICLEDALLVSLPCQHQLCANCKRRLRLPKKCPFCRASFNVWEGRLRKTSIYDPIQIEIELYCSLERKARRRRKKPWKHPERSSPIPRRRHRKKRIVSEAHVSKVSEAHVSKVSKAHVSEAQ